MRNREVESPLHIHFVHPIQSAARSPQRHPPEDPAQHQEDLHQTELVLPGFVWVKIQWSEPFVFKAWGNATAFSVSEALGGRDQQDPQVPPPTPPTPFPSSLFPRRIQRCELKSGNHRLPRGPGHA